MMPSAVDGDSRDLRCLTPSYYDAQSLLDDPANRQAWPLAGGKVENACNHWTATQGAGHDMEMRSVDSTWAWGGSVGFGNFGSIWMCIRDIS